VEINTKSTVNPTFIASRGHKQTRLAKKWGDPRLDESEPPDLDTRSTRQMEENRLLFQRGGSPNFHVDAHPFVSIIAFLSAAFPVPEIRGFRESHKGSVARVLKFYERFCNNLIFDV
jgi:hypothetical protein